MLINLDNLKALSRNNESFIREILELYLANTPIDLEKMKEAVLDENWQTVRYFAHKLKSSSFSIGFEEGHRRLQEIEHLIKNKEDSARIPSLFQITYSVYQACIDEVMAELEKHH